jgi:uncharacterized protein (TIGR02996 family)
MTGSYARAVFLAVDAHGRIARFEDRPAGAAHSMDTDWYAVDREGRVALLRSGEEGAVPWDAHRQYWDEAYDDLVIARIASTSPAEPFSEEAALRRAREAATDPVEAKLLDQILAGDRASRLVYTDWLEQHGRPRRAWSLRDRAVFQVGRELRPIEAEQLPDCWSGVLRFASRDFLELFREEFAPQAWRELDAPLGMTHAVAIGEIYEYQFTDYWNAGVIASAYLLERPVDPEFAGLYEYSCSFSGPYRRSAVPREPLLVAQLPASVQSRFGALRIPRAFDTATEIDPIAFARCHEWNT